MGTSAFERMWKAVPEQKPAPASDTFASMWEDIKLPRGVISETARGLATGLTQAGTTTLESLGYLTGLEGLEEYGREATERAEEYFDPRGTAGAIGRGIGRIGGEIGTSIVGGGAVLKGVGATAKGAKALRGLSAAQRALVAGAAQVPVDVVQGAKEEEGIFLPGRAGAIAESVGLGGLGSLYTARKLRLPAETRPDRLIAARSRGIEPEQMEDLAGPAIPTRGVPTVETRAERLLPSRARGIEPAQMEGVAGPAIPMPADAMDLRRLPQEATAEDIGTYMAQRQAREEARRRGTIPSLSGRTGRRPMAQLLQEVEDERAAIEAADVIGRPVEGALPRSLRRLSDEDLRATFKKWDQMAQETAMTANAMDETAQINFGEQMTRPMGYKRAKELFGEAEEARQYKDFSEEQAGIMQDLNLTPRDIRAMRAANRRLPGLQNQVGRLMAEMERRGMSLVDEAVDFPFGANVGEAVEEAVPVRAAGRQAAAKESNLHIGGRQENPKIFQAPLGPDEAYEVAFRSPLGEIKSVEYTKSPEWKNSLLWEVRRVRLDGGRVIGGATSDLTPERIALFEEATKLSNTARYSSDPKKVAAAKSRLSDLKDMGIRPVREDDLYELNDAALRAEAGEQLNAGIPKPEDVPGITRALSSPDQSWSNSRYNRPGFIQGELLAQGGGALLGGVAGAATAEEGDRADILGRAALGAAAGAGLGRIATQPDRFFRSLTDARSTFEKRLAEGTVGVRKKLPKGEEQFNKSLRQLDPTGRELWREEQKLLEQAGQVRRTVSDREIKDFARTINVDEIVARDLRKLDTVQIAALGNRIVEDRSQLDNILRQLDEGGLPEEQVARLSETRDAILNRLVGYDRVYNAAASEQGRGMRMLGRMMVDTGKVDFSQALRLAKRALDVPRGGALSETATNAIKNIFTDTSMVSDKQRAEALAKVLDDLRGGTPLDVLLDTRRAGLLSAPFSWATNVLGSVAGAAETAIANPIAAALDNAYVALNQKTLGRDIKRTVTFGGRAGTYAKRFREVLPTVLDSNWYKGIDPKNPLADLNQQRINYVNALGLAEKEGEAAWKASLRGGAKILQSASDAIYGVMTATDAPFYEAALAASLKERATLRAMNEFGKEAWGSAPFIARVQELLNPMTTHPVDASMAIAEALDATFKTPTRVARMAREAGPIGAYVAPFANTPTNLIRRGIESVPFVGFIPAKTQTRNIAKRLQALGVSEGEIADEIRRYNTKVLGRQLTSGIGAMVAGYQLAKAGLLTQEYVDPRTATPEQREEMQRRQLTGQAPLTLRIGDTAYSLAPFATLIPALAIGAAMADAAKDEDATFTRTMGRGAQSALRTIGQLPVLQGAETLTEVLTGRAKPATFGREVATFIPFSSAIAAAGRGMDEVGRRRPETFAEGIKERLPFLREQVAPEVGVFGETTPSAGLATTLFSPLRQQRVRTGGLYDILQELDVSPTRPAKREGETQAAYAARRGEEGANERALLEDLLAGNPQAWRFVPAGAKRAFRADVEAGNPQEAWRGALRAALSSQRKEVTGYAKQQAERQARREGLTPNSTAFTERVAQLMAGQP